MARFNAAKIFNAIDKKFQEAYNQLIDLLDTGYSTEANIAGKKVKVNISPKEGISITVDGVKTTGIDASGNFYAARIANGNSPETSFAIIGDLNGGGGSSISLFDIEQQPGFIFQVSETVDISDVLDGFAISDSNNVTRIGISKTGWIIIYDSSGYERMWLDETSNFCMMRAKNGVSYNEIGVDATGAYKITAGVKTYL